MVKAAWMNSRAASEIVQQALRLLAPRELVGVAKRRIGGADDGGYVLADLLTPDQPVLSLGVGPDISFDLQLAEEGHAIVLFDHTVDALPVQHPGFTWHRLGVTGTPNSNPNLRTLAELITRLPHTVADPILKMDVEGAEWDTLANTDVATLRQFAQITLELHDLLRLEEPAFNTTAQRGLRSLTAAFEVIHVHANNCGHCGYVGGFPCPDTLEITLIRRDLAATRANGTWYPTELDRSNWRGGVDIKLWHFPFAPGSETLSAL